MKNNCKFQGSVADHKSFLRKTGRHGILWCGTSKQFVKVFSVKSFLLYSSINNAWVTENFVRDRQGRGGKEMRKGGGQKIAEK